LLLSKVIILKRDLGVNKKGPYSEIPQLPPWQRVRIAQKARYYGDIRPERENRVRRRIFGVAF
jgi:hypothetical protein